MNVPGDVAGSRGYGPTVYDVAFADWCALQGLVVDEDSPHGEAFAAGWRALRAALADPPWRGWRGHEVAT